MLSTIVASELEGLRLKSAIFILFILIPVFGGGEGPGIGEAQKGQILAGKLSPCPEAIVGRRIPLLLKLIEVRRVILPVYSRNEWWGGCNDKVSKNTKQIIYIVSAKSGDHVN